MRKPIVFLAVLTIILCFSFQSNVFARQVRVVQFTPKDRTVQFAATASLRTQIKAVQTFYADQMHAHGYSNKTFQIETDANNAVVVHRITGRHNDVYYHTATLQKVQSEINTYFNTDTEVYAVFVDVSTERIQGNCGIAYFDGGPAMFPLTGDCMTGDAGIDLIAHELGHAFNLEHDFRDDTYIMSYGNDRDRISECAATLLDVSPYFNTHRNTRNTPATLQMLSQTSYTTGDTDWQLEFSATDSDGIHQIQLLHALPNDTPGLLGCQKFDGDRTVTASFTMPTGASLRPEHRVWLRVIDRNGYLQLRDWALYAVEDTNDVGDVMYLTLTHREDNSLTPTNNRSEWDGWEGIWWERYPDGQTQFRPNGFVKPETHIPFFHDWDHFFYSHANSRMVYDLSGGDYKKFNTYFFLPNPCGNIASVEVICLADNTEIYNSGVLRGYQAQNINITFDLPTNTKTLEIKVTDAGDGNTCDHYIFGDPQLSYNSIDYIAAPDANTIVLDVNNDGYVDLSDVMIVRSGMTNKSTYDTDVNNDGVTNILDLLLVKFKAVEVIIAAAPSKRKIQITTWGAMKKAE